MRTLLALVLLSSVAHADEPRLAVGIDPVGVMADDYALAATYSMSRVAAISASVDVSPLERRAALSLPLFLDRAFHGPYVEPGIAVVDRDPILGMIGGYSPMVLTHDNMQRSIEPEMLVGWQWMFHDRVHIEGAVGVARHDLGNGNVYAIPISYLRVGLAL
jgi:hypothetical protein